MKKALIALSFLFLIGCNVEDIEKQREETLQQFEVKKKEIDAQIKKLKASAENVSEDTKKEVERALKKLKRERSKIKKEAENLQKVSKKELENILKRMD